MEDSNVPKWADLSAENRKSEDSFDSSFFRKLKNIIYYSSSAEPEEVAQISNQMENASVNNDPGMNLCVCNGAFRRLISHGHVWSQSSCEKAKSD